MGFFNRKPKEEAANDELRGFAHLKKENFVITAEELGIFPDGCFVSSRLYTDGAPIGWFEKQEANPNMPDSGWWFWAGDGTEDDEFVANPANFKIFKLETLVNYAPEIIPILQMDVPVGTGFERDEAAPNGFRAVDVSQE